MRGTKYAGRRGVAEPSLCASPQLLPRDDIAMKSRSVKSVPPTISSERCSKSDEVHSIKPARARMSEPCIRGQALHQGRSGRPSSAESMLRLFARRISEAPYGLSAAIEATRRRMFLQSRALLHILYLGSLYHRILNHNVAALTRRLFQKSLRFVIL